MGGAVGGAIKGVVRGAGLGAKAGSEGRTVQVAPEPAEQPPKPGVTQATQQQEKEGSRMRGARRRGRSLLSDARLMGEAGIETLGGGTNL